MIATINFIVLIISSVMFTIFYLNSLRPVTLSKTMGDAAYQLCAMYRVIGVLFMVVAGINYILYYWFPLSLPIPRTFPWPCWVSAVLAVLITIPSGWLVARGIKDAGEETVRPKPEHTLYGGIYLRMRHPQAVGEFPFWWVLALLAHSPFLMVFTLLYIPIWYWFYVVEEKDLVLRYGQAYEEYRKKTGFWFTRKK